MKATAATLKAGMGTEDEPFEGEVPLADVEPGHPVKHASTLVPFQSGESSRTMPTRSQKISR